MEMYGKVALILNQRGWKLEAKLTSKVKVDVTKFTAGNGEKYIHINRNGNTLSLHYEEYKELCLIKEAIDGQLHHLDEPTPPELTAPELAVVSTTVDSATSASVQPTAVSPATASSSPAPLQLSAHVPMSYAPLTPVEGIQYGTTPPSYYPCTNVERRPPPPYQASQRHHPYNKQ